MSFHAELARLVLKTLAFDKRVKALTIVSVLSSQARTAFLSELASIKEHRRNSLSTRGMERDLHLPERKWRRGSPMIHRDSMTERPLESPSSRYA